MFFKCLSALSAYKMNLTNIKIDNIFFNKINSIFYLICNKKVKVSLIYKIKKERKNKIPYLLLKKKKIIFLNFKIKRKLSLKSKKDLQYCNNFNDR